MKERFCCGGPRKKVSPSVSAPLHLILQAPTPASHEWKKVSKIPGVNHLCQLCHLTVDGQGVQCKDCGLCAHSQCGSFYPVNTNSIHSHPQQGVSSSSSLLHYTNNLITRVPESNNSESSPQIFEPRIKKLLQVSIPPVPPPNSIHSENSTRLSSCGGDSSSTAILVGTTTISASQTPRSQSKTPEITNLTPGSVCEVAEETEDPGSSSERVQQDSGCGGLLLECEELEDGISEYDSRNHTHHPQKSKNQDSAGIRYCDGPLDGALYALVNPVKPKGPSSADSGISVTIDQMKDLDRLLNALVQDAESIPDIPYHAREDSLPFSYGIPDQAALRRRQEQQERREQNQHQQPIYHQSQSAPTSFASTPQRQQPPQQQSTTYYSSPPHSAPPHYNSTNNSKGTDQIDYRNLPTQTYYHSSTPSKPHYHNHPSSNSHFEKSIQTPRVHHLHLNLEDRILPKDRNRESEYGNYSSDGGGTGNRRLPLQNRFERINSRDIYSHQPPTSISFNDFNNTPSSTIYSNSINNGGGKRLRSQSADGRRNNERSEDADAWLARQMQRLQEKKTSKYPVRNDWLAELKRSLPNEKSLEGRNDLVRPSSTARIYARSNVSTPAWYSSDDEEFDREVEREMFSSTGPIYQSPYGNRGRRIQRYHSENAYDRIQRAPSSQSYTSSIGGGNDPIPGFPTCPPTPYLNRPLSPGKPPRSPKSTRRSTTSTPTTPTITINEWGNSEPQYLARVQTPVNPKPVFMIESEVKFARDLSAFWYKPNASREETISALRFQRTGAFIIRNSNSFPGAYGLAIKVDENSTSEDSVRHFLIEPTKYGVRLRGSAVEPVFSSLSALVYGHSIETLALPANLTLPTSDSVLPSAQSQSNTTQLLSQGAACQLLFLGVVGVECVTGDDAVSRGVRAVIGVQTPTVVSLRLSKHGLTLTDIFRQRFFRLHFPLGGISYAAGDPQHRTILYENSTRKIFAVIARSPSAVENSCVVLAELEEGQPAHAIIAFFQRVIAWKN